MSKPLHWYIQKPQAHNCPYRTNGAVFQEFEPTIAEQGGEWVKVVEAKAYDAVVQERDELEANLAEYRGVDKTDHRHQPCVNRIEQLERALERVMKEVEMNTDRDFFEHCKVKVEKLERGE